MLTLANRTRRRSAPSRPRTDRIGFLARRQVAGVREGDGGALSDVNRGVFVQPFPATGAMYQAPQQLVDFHPVWAASGAELVYTAAAAVGGMVAVRVTPRVR